MMGATMTIKERIEWSRKDRNDDAEEAKDQLIRVLALIEAAKKVSADYKASTSEKFDENKWDRFPGVWPIDEAIADMERHGDIPPTPTKG